VADETTIRALREAAKQLQQRETIAVDLTSAIRYAANRLFRMHALAKQESETPTITLYRVVVWQSLTGGWDDGDTYAENLTEYEAHVKWIEAYKSRGNAVGMRVQIVPMGVVLFILLHHSQTGLTTRHG
jgi:hypothetical protein